MLQLADLGRFHQLRGRVSPWVAVSLWVHIDNAHKHQVISYAG